MPHTKDNYIFKPDIERISVQGSKDTIKVPFNKINLSNGDSVLVSTVEGPDVNAKTLPKVNEGYTPYIIDGDKKKVKKTQLDFAKEGKVTDYMEYVAIRESFKSGENMPFTPEDVCSQMAKGVAVIPSNINHEECEPMIIGKHFSVKVNANIGASSLSSNFDEEIKKDPWLNLICEIKGKKRLKLKEPKHIFTTCSESKNKIK